MSQWDSRVDDAAVWADLERLEESLDEAMEEAEEQDHEEVVISIERLRAVCRHVEQQLSSADAFLVGQRTLNNLSSNTKGAKEAVDQYVSSGDRSKLLPSGDQNGAHHGDMMLVYAEQIPGMAPDEAVEELRDTVRSVRYSAGQYMRRLEEDAEEIRESIEEVRSLAEERIRELQEALNGEMNRIEQEVEKAHDEISQNATQWLSKLEERIESQKQRISDALTRFENTFESDESERRETFSDKLDAWKQEFEKAYSDYKDRAESLVKAMEEDRAKVENLMGVVGASARASGYKKQADYQRYASYFWRGLALLALGALVWSAWWLVDETVSAETVNWYAFAGKFTLLGAIGVFAGYAVRQGRGHLEQAQKFRQLQLELVSIKPYLAEFPDDQERAILTRFAPRWFGNLPTGSSEDDEKFMEEFLQMAEDWLRRGNVTEGEPEG